MSYKEDCAGFPDCIIQENTEMTMAKVALIRHKFKRHWKGSNQQLDDAMEAFFKDIRESYTVEMESEDMETILSNKITQSVEEYARDFYFV